jgi:cell division protein FtsI/penicillin-binding protein 2
MRAGSIFARAALLLAALAAVGATSPTQTDRETAILPAPLPDQAAWQSAVAQAAHDSPQARIVVLDALTGRLMAANHLAEAAHTLANPGSAMKPLTLYELVNAGRWNPSQRIACSRKLRIAGHSLNCSHPAEDAMDARQALTWSCNTYFAAVAGTLRPDELRGLLDATGLLAQTGLVPGEATAFFHDPQTPDQIRLAYLGVDGVRVTPLEFARAYRWLGQQLVAHPDSAAAQVVRAGLQDSASFGMAGAADLGGVPVAGKTGTASGQASGGGPVHGWFICLAPALETRAVIAIYLPVGHGNDAARVAADLLSHSPLRQPQKAQ